VAQKNIGIMQGCDFGSKTLKSTTWPIPSAPKIQLMIYIKISSLE